MTVKQRQFLKDNWKGYVTMANLVLLSGFIIGQAKWQQKVDDHVDDTSIHMPLETKVETFMLRSEIESRLDRMDKQLDRIERKLD